MAALATLVDWISGIAGVRETAGHSLPARGDRDFQLRPLPNEEIYFYVREVDNSRVMPKADPRSVGVCWRFIGGSCLAALLLVAVLAPMAYNVLAGYQISTLEHKREMLLREQAELELKEAMLVSPERLAELGRLQNLVDPAPETVVSLPPATGRYIAKNRSLSNE